MDIKDIKVGMALEGTDLLVDSIREAVTKNGKPYATISLRDATASVDAKLWDYDKTKHACLQKGHVAKIWASVEEFAGRPQLSIKDATTSTKKPEDFLRKSEFDLEKMWDDLLQMIQGFKEPLTKFVAEELLIKQAQVLDLYKRAPAANKVHNAWIGGVLEHSHAMATLAKPVVAHYRKYCPKLSEDKVLFGCIVHDIGKIAEYNVNSPSFDYTPAGLLTPHLVSGPAWVMEAANRWTGPKDQVFKSERMELMHIIAAHHGKLEWGSPCPPATIEAIIVHMLDYEDSQIMHAVEMIQGKAGTIPGFSERSWVMGTSFKQN